MNKPSIKANWLFNLVNKLVAYMSPLIVAPYVSRIFGPDGIGINSYTTANVTYFTLFCMLGIGGYGRRIIAISRDNKEDTSKLFWELFILHGITSLMILVLYLFLIAFSDKYRIYYTVNLITVFASVIDYNWFLEAYENFKFISIRNCILKILTLILTFVLIHSKEDLVLYIGINAMSTFLANLSILFQIPKYILRVPIRELKWMRHIKEVLIYFVPTIAASVYSILDKSVINWITGSDAENGYYEQAYKLIMVINTFVHSLETVSEARMSNLFANGTDKEFRDRLNASVHIMLFIAMPCAFGMAAVAPTLVPVFFGVGFEKVVSIIYIFVPLILVLGFSVYLDGLYLVPSGQRGKSATAVCIGAALNLGLNIIFVIKWQSIGAAFATLITETVICCIMICLSIRKVDWKLILVDMLKYGMAGLIMFGTVRFVSICPLSDIALLAVQVCSGALIYALLLLIVGDEYVKGVVYKILRK